jgi:hypothetical protein
LASKEAELIAEGSKLFLFVCAIKKMIFEISGILQAKFSDQLENFGMALYSGKIRTWGAN